MIIELWILADDCGRIYYTGFQKQLVKDYQDANNFKDTFIIKLTGEKDESAS